MLGGRGVTDAPEEARAIQRSQASNDENRQIDEGDLPIRIRMIQDPHTVEAEFRGENGANANSARPLNPGIRAGDASGVAQATEKW
jgi:hypothetical protein